jgi:hypothetical protein
MVDNLIRDDESFAGAIIFPEQILQALPAYLPSRQPREVAGNLGV